MKNKLWIISIIIATGFAFTACGSDDSDSTSAPKLIEVANTAEWNVAINDIKDGGNDKSYIINISSNFSVAGTDFTDNNFGDATGISVTLQGNGEVSLNSNGAIIWLNGDQTLIIDGNLILKGRPGNDRALLYVVSGAKFVMKKGTISGNTTSGTNGSGVRISNSTFIMSGGTISGNTTEFNGGGVFVVGGTFTKTGGNIYGSDGGGNSNNAQFDTSGHAVYYIDGANEYYRDTTLNTNDKINTNQLPASGTGYNWTKILP